jgi:hypothetical protein
MCAPAKLKITVPFSRAALTSSRVILASSKEFPLVLDTVELYQVFMKENRRNS